MAKIGVRIEATEEGTEQRSGDFPNLPNGVYSLEMEAGDVIEKDKDTPQHVITVKMTAQVVEPAEFAGRKMFVNYNIQHPNSQAQDIGNRQFQCLLRALELTEVPGDDTDNLLFKSFTATIGMGKDSKEKNADGSPKYAARNEIKRYWFPDQGDTPAIGVTGPAPEARAPANDNRAPAAQQQAARPAATGNRPWGSKK
jgi:hypothetical protein